MDVQLFLLLKSGLLQVPDDVREAATAMGYSRFARLVRVELPLALPGILVGLLLYISDPRRGALR